MASGRSRPKESKVSLLHCLDSSPVVSWLARYIGHVRIAREDGIVMDFAGSNLVSVDDLAYGSAARCLQLDRKKVCITLNCLFPPRFMFLYQDFKDL